MHVASQLQLAPDLPGEAMKRVTTIISGVKTL